MGQGNDILFGAIIAWVSPYAYG